MDQACPLKEAPRLKSMHPKKGPLTPEWHLSSGERSIGSSKVLETKAPQIPVCTMQGLRRRKGRAKRRKRKVGMFIHEVALEQRFAPQEYPTGRVTEEVPGQLVVLGKWN